MTTQTVARPTTEQSWDWQLEHLPKSAEEFGALGEDIKRFEREMIEGRGVA